MAPITGGCHYFWDCKGYLSDCSSCPAIKTNITFSPKKQLSRKIENFSKITIGLLASSDIGLETMKQAKIKYNSYTKIPYPINTDIFNYTNVTEREEIFKIFFNAQNITDERKGWMYFKEYILFLDKLISTIGRVFKVELITTNEQAHVKELGNLKNISLISFGWANNDESLTKLYQKANLMICTSVEDLSPLMVNEALLCGVPVFGFDNASNREYIYENINGAIFKFGDTQAMAEKTIQYIQNRDLLKDKITIRNSIIEIHQKESWYKNHFMKILNND